MLRWDDGVRSTVSSAERGLKHLPLAVGVSNSNDRSSSTAIKPILRQVQSSDPDGSFPQKRGVDESCRFSLETLRPI